MKAPIPSPTTNDEVDLTNAQSTSLNQSTDLFAGSSNRLPPGQSDDRSRVNDSDVLNELGAEIGFAYGQNTVDYYNGVMTASDVLIHRGGFQLLGGNESFQFHFNVDGAIAGDAEAEGNNLDSRFSGRAGVDFTLGNYVITGQYGADNFGLDRSAWVGDGTSNDESDSLTTQGLDFRVAAQDWVIPIYVELNIDTQAFNSVLGTVGVAKSWDFGENVSLDLGAELTAALDPGEIEGGDGRGIVEEAGLVSATAWAGATYHIPVPKSERDFDSINLNMRLVGGHSFQDNFVDEDAGGQSNISLLFGVNYTF